jgi:hypothetical protein
MGVKIVKDIPMDIDVIYKSHIPSMSIIEMKVNAIHFHKGSEINQMTHNISETDRPSFSIELIDPTGKVLPRMTCIFKYYNDKNFGYRIKENMHLNIHRIVSGEDPEIEKVDREILSNNLEWLKDNYPHYCL